MNLKKAKRLRVRAHVLTIGMVHTAYRRNKRTGAISLTPECTKGVYRWLKRSS